MHCRPVLTPIEWLAFCENSWTCYYFLWKKLSFHFWFSPIFRLCPPKTAWSVWAADTLLPPFEAARVSCLQKTFILRIVSTKGKKDLWTFGWNKLEKHTFMVLTFMGTQSRTSSRSAEASDVRNTFVTVCMRRYLKRNKKQKYINFWKQKEQESSVSPRGLGQSIACKIFCFSRISFCGWWHNCT